MESTTQLREKAGALGPDLATAEAAGVTRLLVLLAYLEADQIAALLREDVERLVERWLPLSTGGEATRR